MLQAQWCRYRLEFKFLARTSREEMRYKDTYFIRLTDSERPDAVAYGECALFRGLSADDTPGFEDALRTACANPVAGLPAMSAIRFGFEAAMAELNGLPSTPWTEGREGIVINGLVWMGDKKTMLERVEEKLQNGFRVIKLKIGGIDFEEELSILKSIRERFTANELEIRLDANGSFATQDALRRLDRLSRYDIHSLEQPIRAGYAQEMARICARSPIDIALDEELIGCRSAAEMEDLLDFIKPKYIILKPSLCGGFSKADEWISIAGRLGIGWWATSALESDIGLKAIATWLSTKPISMPQGLGTGELYTNNIPSSLSLRGDKLYNRPDVCCHIPDLQWQR